RIILKEGCLNLLAFVLRKQIEQILGHRVFIDDARHFPTLPSLIWSKSKNISSLVPFQATTDAIFQTFSKAKRTNSQCIQWNRKLFCQMLSLFDLGAAGVLIVLEYHLQILGRQTGQT